MDVSELEGRSSPSWNPLRCDGTALPAAWLLSAKLLATSLFRQNSFQSAGPPYLPFFAVFDAPFFASWLAPVTAAAFYLSFISLMFNRRVRTACLIIAVCILTDIASHRMHYANNVLFVAVFLLIIALHDPRWGNWPLRIQFALVYGGAAVNKSLDPDWWSGRFFDTLMIDALHIGWYQSLAARLPEQWLGTVFGALTISTEVLIGLLVLVAQGGRAGVLLMVMFQVAMLVSTQGQLSIPFLYASVAASAVFFYTPLWVPPRWVSRTALHDASPAVWWFAALFIREIPRFLGRVD